MRDNEVMTKSLEQRIAARVARSADAQHGARRVALLAQQDEIARAVAAGWTVKDIWRTLSEEGRITASYQSSCDCVNRWIRKTDKPARRRQPPTGQGKVRSHATPRRSTCSAFTLNLNP